MIYLVYAVAAFAEIAGCFAFWAWMRLGKSLLWLVPGMLSLALFGWLLTLIPADAAGRAYAAYGGVYITASIVWLWIVEGNRPDRWDIAGGCGMPGGRRDHPSSCPQLNTQLNCGLLRQASQGISKRATVHARDWLSISFSCACRRSTAAEAGPRCSSSARSERR